MKYFNSLLCVLVSVFSSSSLANATSLVPAICKDISKADPKNVSYGFCVLELQSSPISSKATAPQLGEISFQLTTSNANGMYSAINKLSMVPALDPHAKIVLKDCLDLYSEVLDDLDAGLRSLKSGDFEAAKIKVSAVLRAAATCGKGIKNNGKRFDLMIKMNNHFYGLAAISLGFAKLLPIVNMH